MAEARVKIYTRTACPYCHKALDILRKNNVPYDEVNIAGREELRDEIERLTGRRDVPQILIDGKHIGDDDHLVEWEKAGKLKELSA
ncbi:MAG: glutaredoxin [Candidatus Poribacteria bacterium]|nr:glutaredoxin [Candidatus Poribacteria bacterium]